MLLLSCLTALLAATTAAMAQNSTNSTFLNPVLPGWHSDPSCILVDDMFFCVTSTFISFPGLPIYASKDLMDYKLISHAWSRETQIPDWSWATVNQLDGMFAATIRYHEGIFYVICEYLGINEPTGVLFKTTDPYDETAWSDPVRFIAPKIDPDLFWDDDGKVYVATQGIILQEIDLETGEMGPVTELWNGTGGVWPEGPHIYKRDGYYYLLIAEGGTSWNHAVTMARAKNITGPYEASPHNPHLTNRGTPEYFQTVGHADLFQDGNGNWWAVALATRANGRGSSYPMGRETVLTPVTWNTGEWPIFQKVEGNMTGWALPPRSRDIPGEGPFNNDPDVYDFPAGSSIPRNLVYWRVPRDGAFEVTDKGLQVVLGRNDVAGQFGDHYQPATKAISFIGRRQTDSTFDFSVDLSFAPNADKQEAGITAFLTQADNIQLGIYMNGDQLSLRYAVMGQNTTTSLPASWKNQTVRLEIHMPSPTQLAFSASLASDESSKISAGNASTTLLSGRTGEFVGTLVGIYATCNGVGPGIDCPEDTPKAYFNRWRYTGISQEIYDMQSVPSSQFNQAVKYSRLGFSLDYS